MVNYQNLTCNLAWTKVRGSRAKFQPKKSYGPRIKSQEPCTNSQATRNSGLGPGKGKEFMFKTSSAVPMSLHLLSELILPNY